MKKIMMIVLACAMLAACGGKTVEEQAIDYNEQMLEALEAGDLKKMEAIEEAQLVRLYAKDNII